MNSLKELVEQKKWLLHVETATVGQAEKLYQPNEYISSINKEPVNAVVLEYATGDTFVVKDDKTFVPLTGQEEQMYIAFNKMITGALEIVGRGAAIGKMTMDVFGVLASSALRTQERALAQVISAHNSSEAMQ